MKYHRNVYIGKSSIRKGGERMTRSDKTTKTKELLLKVLEKRSVETSMLLVCEQALVN